MAYFYNIIHVNRIFLWFVLTIFTLNILTPNSVCAQVNIVNVTFALRMEKLIEKIKKQKDKKESNKVIDTMLEIKSEIEAYTGKVINLDKEFNKVEAELKKNNSKFDKKLFQAVKGSIKNRERKANHKAVCMEAYLLDAPNITFKEYFLLANEDKKRDIPEIELPINLTIGITMILAGGFLCVAGLECPPLMSAGKYLAGTGFGLALDGFGKKYDENKAKEKQKNNI